MFRSHRSAVLNVILALLMLSACHSDPAPSVEAVQVNDEFRRSLQRNHLTFAAALSDDGWITFKDYEAATMAFIKCASSHGATLRANPEVSKRLRYFYVLETPSGRDLRSEMLACRGQYLDPIEFVWARYKPVTEQEASEAGQLMATCLRSASSTAGGQSVPPDPSEPKRRECARLVFEKTGLPDYYVWE